jgi:glucose-6-phosphate dehydrogenase assembly protein OpcA
MPAALAPEKILREVHELWVSLGREAHAETGDGVLRSCTMTLVVLAEAGEDSSAVGEAIAALMPEYPARAISIRLRGAAPGALGERVYAQCWKPFGQRRQICCEQIEIDASDADLPDLWPVLLALAAPDLPLILWCRSPRLAAMPAFEPIARLARKVVVDTVAFPDAKAALRAIAEISARGIALGDLAWARLTRWRSMLSQVFENRACLDLLPGISNIGVTWGGTYEPLGWYMAAWLRDALADAGVRPSLDVRAERAESLIRVELTGPNFRLRLHREGDRLVVEVNDSRSCTSLTQPGDYLMMREELSIVRRDPIFERTLASAARLAYAGDK